eukprot:CAMPEP_0114111190 /NCGR_PEP_ID=MMETSP0043_2-20121206/1721_1 /TAXON_ID=464988 /ORGANISM="Hemiselmis andersenii, Strain CCMP644" /LENGTH=339 /DNA_ID=CAMNT_0001203205 /DNA_START=235 /DNA_END=1250 /DNA_ORIENTATION=+
MGFTGFTVQERVDSARLIADNPCFQDITVERISDAILNGEHGKARIKKLEFERGHTLWEEGSDITRDGIYYVFSGKCSLTRLVKVVPNKEIRQLDPELAAMARGTQKVLEAFEVGTALRAQSVGDEAILGASTYKDTVQTVTECVLIFIPSELINTRFSNALPRLREHSTLCVSARDLRHAKRAALFPDEEEEEEDTGTKAKVETTARGTRTVKLIAVDKDAKRYYRRSGTSIFRAGINFEAGMVPRLGQGSERRPLGDHKVMSFVRLGQREARFNPASAEGRMRPASVPTRVDMLFSKLWHNASPHTLSTLHTLQEAAALSRSPSKRASHAPESSAGG